MSLGLIIFLLVILTWLVATIIELINLNRFNLKFFSFGRTIYRHELKVEFSNWKYFDGIYEEKEGKYVFIPDLKTGYFVTRFRFYRQHSILSQSSGMPLTIFGDFEESNGILKINYKISYRLLFLILAWLTPWVVVPIISAIKGNFIGLAVGLEGIAFTILFLYFIYIFQNGKMLLISDEISRLLKIRK